MLHSDHSNYAVKNCLCYFRIWLDLLLAKYEIKHRIPGLGLAGNYLPMFMAASYRAPMHFKIDGVSNCIHCHSENSICLKPATLHQPSIHAGCGGLSWPIFIWHAISPIILTSVISEHWREISYERPVITNSDFSDIYIMVEIVTSVHDSNLISRDLNWYPRCLDRYPSILNWYPSTLNWYPEIPSDLPMADDDHRWSWPRLYRQHARSRPSWLLSS